MLLRACRHESSAAPSAALAASRCAAAEASGSGGLRRFPIASRIVGRGLSSYRDDFPIGPPPDWDRSKCKFAAEEKDLESDEALWALYQRWCVAFDEKRDPDEMRRRFDKFKQTVFRVDAFNKWAIREGKSARLGINMFADGKLRELLTPRVPMFTYIERGRLPPDALRARYYDTGLYARDFEEAEEAYRNPFA